MLVRFNKKSSSFVEGSLGLVLHDVGTQYLLVRAASPYKGYVRSYTVLQDLWVPKDTFSKVRHNKENLRAFNKAIKKLPRSWANCQPFYM